MSEFVPDAAAKLAIERAVKDALVERELHDHAEHLSQINGSQREMAAALTALRESFAQIAAANEAVVGYIREQAGRRLSKRNLWLMALGAVSGYGGLIGSVLSNHHF